MRGNLAAASAVRLASRPDRWRPGGFGDMTLADARARPIHSSVVSICWPDRRLVTTFAADSPGTDDTGPDHVSTALNSPLCPNRSIRRAALRCAPPPWPARSALEPEHVGRSHGFRSDDAFSCRCTVAPRPRRASTRDLLDWKGIVVKSHGSADVFGFFSRRAIERAMEEVRNEVLAPPDAAVRTDGNQGGET